MLCRLISKKTCWNYFACNIILSSKSGLEINVNIKTHILSLLFSEIQEEKEKKEEEKSSTGRHRRRRRRGPGGERIRRARWRRTFETGASREARLWLHRAAGQRESLQDTKETGRGHLDPWAVRIWKHHRQWALPQVWAETQRVSQTEKHKSTYVTLIIVYMLWRKLDDDQK